MDDLLFRTTIMIARRLLKSRLRLFLSRLMESGPEGENWKPVITFEEGVEEEAKQAWRNVRGCWATSSTSKAMLEFAAKQAYRQAKLDVISLFQGEVDVKWLRTSIRKYRPTLE
jgi:hypothetical protein